MQERNELKCTMSRRAWGWLGLAVVAGIGGAILWAMGGLAGLGVTIGVALCIVGIALALWVALTQRSMLVADAQGFTYRSWRGSHTIAWNRLSSLQLKNNRGSYYATDIVVVNDMGRKEMQIPVHLFGRVRVHDWMATLPARSSGRENLLD